MTVLFAILLFFSTQAQAMLFEWSGSCAVNCSGVAHALFTVREDYVPGTNYTCGAGLTCAITDIVYFDNTRSTHLIDTLPHDQDYITGVGRFPASPFDPGFSHIGFYIGDTYDFPFWSSFSPLDADPLGHWSVYGQDATHEFLTQGVGGRFSAVIPEPATWLLIGLGLVILICLFRWKPRLEAPPLKSYKGPRHPSGHE